MSKHCAGGPRYARATTRAAVGGGADATGRAIRGSGRSSSSARTPSRTRDCQFNSYFRTLKARKSHKQALRGSGTDYQKIMAHRNAPRWIRMMKEYNIRGMIKVCPRRRDVSRQMGCTPIALDQSNPDTTRYNFSKITPTTSRTLINAGLCLSGSVDRWIRFSNPVLSKLSRITDPGFIIRKRLKYA